jgi:hypothetical protein
VSRDPDVGGSRARTLPAVLLRRRVLVAIQLIALAILLGAFG